MPKYVVKVRQVEVWRLEFEAENAEEARKRVIEFWNGDGDDESDPELATAVVNADVDSDEGEILDVRKKYEPICAACKDVIQSTESRLFSLKHQGDIHRTCRAEVDAAMKD